MDKLPVSIIVGSARKGSYSKVVAETVMSLLPDTLQPRILDIADLPIYNQDFDDVGPLPEAYGSFRALVKESKGFLFVTPEHNRSVPALLKNALDVASRPYGANVWGGKPGAVISVSPGALAAFGANHILRQSMVFLDVLMMQQPEAYIGNVVEMIGADGKISAAKSLDFLKMIAQKYADWVVRLQK